MCGRELQAIYFPFPLISSPLNFLLKPTANRSSGASSFLSLNLHCFLELWSCTLGFWAHGAVLPPPPMPLPPPPVRPLPRPPRPRPNPARFRSRAHACALPSPRGLASPGAARPCSSPPHDATSLGAAAAASCRPGLRPPALGSTPY